MTRVKICCIRSVEEAELAAAAGASALGLVSRMPTGTGVLSDEEIRALVPLLPPGPRKFLLTCRTDRADVADQVRRCGTDTVQLVDHSPPSLLRELRADLPGIALVQVVHVRDASAISYARTVAPLADGLLLDSGDPGRPGAALGGTGRVHDWAISAELVASVSCPVFLAGGLSPDNVAEAILRVRPYGVDACSRLRPSGRLDAVLLNEFFSAVEGVGAAA